MQTLLSVALKLLLQVAQAVEYFALLSFLCPQAMKLIVSPLLC